MNFYSTNWKRGALLLSLLAFSSTRSFAIDSLRISLDDIIAKAMAHSKYIEQSELKRREKEVIISEKRADLLPKINLRSSATYASNMPIYDKGIFNKPSQHDVVHYLYDNNLDFYLNLYNGHRDLMSIQSAQLEKKLAEVDWLEANAQIKMEVCNLYLDLQQSYAHKSVIENDILEQKEQLKQIKNMHKAGTALWSDVLRIEVEVSKRELLLVQIKHDILNYNQQIQFITGLQDIIVPMPFVFDKTLPSYDEMIKQAKSQAFILQKSAQEVQLKKLAVKQAKSNYLPELGLTSSFTFSNPQIFLYPYNDSWYNLAIVGLKLNIPISAYYQNKHVVQKAHINYEMEKVKHHHEEEELENNMLTAYLDYQLALKEKEVKSHHVDLAKENARIIKNRYFKSSALITELLDVDMQYLQTLFELEAATIAIQKQYYFIEFLKGTI